VIGGRFVSFSLSSHGSLGLIQARERVRRERKREKRIKVYLCPYLSFSRVKKEKLDFNVRFVDGVN
jgi:hypothetical protein